MQNLAVVDHRKRFAKLNAYVQGVTHVEALSTRQHAAQRAALQKLHDHVGVALGRFTGIEYTDDSGVSHDAEDARLLQQTIFGGTVVASVGREHFHRNRFVQDQVSRREDRTNPTTRYLSKKLVASIDYFRLFFV
jgi:hypothetical protein